MLSPSCSCHRLLSFYSIGIVHNFASSAKCHVIPIASPLRVPPLASTLLAITFCSLATLYIPMDHLASLSGHNSPSTLYAPSRDGVYNHKHEYCSMIGPARYFINNAGPSSSDPFPWPRNDHFRFRACSGGLLPVSANLTVSLPFPCVWCLTLNVQASNLSRTSGQSF